MQIRKLKRDQVVSVHCKELVPEGFGLCHIEVLEEAPVKPLTGFIWGILPGEKGLARVARVKKNHFHGTLLNQEQTGAPIVSKPGGESFAHKHWALYEVAEQRIDAGCDNFVACGGCKLQHLSYEDGLGFKENWLINHLSHQGLELPEIEKVSSPRLQHYRNHVQVHINKHKHRGFYAPFSYRTVQFPEHGCRLFDQQSFDKDFPVELELERCVRSRVDYIDNNIGHWSLYSADDKKAKFTYHIEYPPRQKIAVTIPNAAFFQVNTSALPQWLQAIADLISEYTEGENCLELFSGFGFISLLTGLKVKLTSYGADILHPRDLKEVSLSTDDAETEQKLQQSKNAFNERYLQVDLTNTEKIEKLKEAPLAEVDFVLMNPPRSGFKEIEFFLKEILPAKKPFIYSSCNSASFARDAAVLAAEGYRLRRLFLFDFFPYTSHFEVLAAFTV